MAECKPLSSTACRHLPQPGTPRWRSLRLRVAGRVGGGVAALSRAAPPESVVKCDAYLAAVGRTPNTRGFEGAVDLDEHGCVIVDGNLRTSRARVYAAGDCVGRPSLASTGVAQGIAAIATIFDGAADADADAAPEVADEEHSLARLAAGGAHDPGALAADPFAYPVGMWTSPEVSYFGLTLEQALARGIEAEEAIALYKE